VADNLLHPDERVDQVILAYLEALDAGHAPDPEEVLARHPDLALELRSFFADQDRVRRLTAPLRQPAPCPNALDQTADEVPTAVGLAPGPLPPAVGAYRPLRLLGAGGMGRVYEAEDASGRRVALKLISPGFADSHAALERFRQEGRLASRITHPRCVFVHEADEQAGQPYIVMELMPGDTLKDLVERQGPLPADEAIAKVLDIIEGLEEAHQAGVIHRDMKPANCYVEADGRVKVGDFGLSRSLTANLHLTRTGGFVGTPLFASPEQLKGERLDPRTDVYSVAATLYYLLTGRAPFEGAEGASLIARVVSEAAPPVRSLRPDISAALEAVVLRGLERQRERRFQSLDEVRAALLPLLPDRLSVAGVGLRIGAHFLDSLLFGIIGELVGLWSVRSGLHPSLPAYLALVTPLFLYFWLCDGLWGGTPGKRVVRLRVTRANGSEAPGLRQALIRTAVFLGLGGLIVNLCLYAVLDRSQHLAWAACQGAGAAAGLALCFCTMRARSGYRGLHEFLSGTRVVQLPAVRRLPFRQPLTTDSHPRPGGMGRAGNVPAQLGTFLIRGALRWDAESRVLLGEDPALERRAWIQLRTRAEGPLPPLRKELARSTRLRWLAEGDWEKWRWDAFVAPEGERLTDLIARHGPLDWRATRPVFEQLADELLDAAADGTLPGALGPGQVWVRPSGRVQLLDPVSAKSEPVADPEKAGLSLLRGVAVLALEGHAVAEEKPRGPIRALVPLHARRLLEHLIGCRDPYQRVADMRADLAATHTRPTEATPALRALHLATSFCFLAVGLFAVLAWSRAGALGRVLTLDQMIVRGQVLRHVLDHDDLREALFSELPPEHNLRLHAGAYPYLLERRQALDRHEARERIDGLGPVGSVYLIVPALRARGSPDAADERLRIERRPGQPFTLVVTRPDLPDESPLVLHTEQLERAAVWADEGTNAGPERTVWAALGGGLLLLSFFPALWVVWAFIFRGGLGLRVAGLALVRSSGKDALRVQCAWRAFLVWAPVMAPLLLIPWIDACSPSLAWLCTLLQGVGALVLVGYAALAVRFPQRGPHDRLAGTYLVPR
jgi:hypothetical protein